MIAIWDIRDASLSTPKLKATGHKDDVMSLSWNPFREFLLLSASVDKTVRLWDSRNLRTEMHKFEGHRDEVLNGERAAVAGRGQEGGSWAGRHRGAGERRGGRQRLGWLLVVGVQP
jgi:WD40 repeat protein